MSKFLSCEDVAVRYDVKIITVWNWIRKGKLGAMKIGKNYLISEEDIARLEANSKCAGDKYEANNS